MNGPSAPQAVFCFVTQGALIWLQHHLGGEPVARPCAAAAPVGCICQLPEPRPVECGCDFREIREISEFVGPLSGWIAGGTCLFQVGLRLCAVHAARRAVAQNVDTEQVAPTFRRPRRLIAAPPGVGAVRFRIADTADSPGSQSDVSGLLALYDAQRPGPHSSPVEDW